jgi:hypothetical protein
MSDIPPRSSPGISYSSTVYTESVQGGIPQGIGKSARKSIPPVNMPRFLALTTSLCVYLMIELFASVALDKPRSYGDAAPRKNAILHAL